MTEAAKTFEQHAIDWYTAEAPADQQAYTFSEVWNDDFSYLLRHTDQEIIFENGPVEVVDQHGGEGQGDELYVVVSYDNKFFKIEGYWVSWDGANWDDPTPFEVTPKQVMVTKYERVR